MKKVISVIICGLLAGCACDENQWEEVEVVEGMPYVEETAVVAEPAPAIVQQQPVMVQPEPVYIPAPVPAPAYDCPCARVQAQPCYQPQPVYQPCGCQPMPAPQPKVTTTKKIITTTTTTQEPCGKPVCEPVVTVHEEIVPAEVSYPGAVNMHHQPVPNDYVEVTVEKNPYHSKVVGMRSSSSKVDAATVAKYTPEVYTVVANRATNRMLQDTAAIYDNGGRTKTIYLKDTELLSSDLPYGSHRLKGATKEIINGSGTYDVVNNPQNADFIVEGSADWYVTPDNTVPALQYKLSMFDRNGKKVNEWVEIIRQVQD